MPRLPKPGGDAGNWGEILNEFLSVEHTSDGKLNPSGTISLKYTKPEDGIPASDLDSATQSILAESQTTKSRVDAIEQPGWVARDRLSEDVGTMMDEHIATDQLLSVALQSYPAEMPDPPSVSIGNAGAASSIAGAITLLPDSSSFTRLRHAGYKVSGGIYLPTGAAQTQLPAALEFMFDSDQFEIFCRDDTATIRIMVDGLYVSYTPISLTTSGQNRHIHVDFGSSVIRHIRIESSLLALRSIKVPPTATVWTSSHRASPRVIMLGDSYLGGIDGIGLSLGHYLGWSNVWEDGVGGTGYLKQNGSYEPLSARLDTDLFPHSPDIVIIALGLNDANYFAPSEIQAAAQSVYESILSTLPDTKLAVVGPWWPSGTPTAAILAARDAIKTAATGRAHLFIDPIVSTTAAPNTLGWITGTGKIGATTGSGNADLYINNDGTHPSGPGRRYLAGRIANSLAILGLA